jgi:hypothetical protein
MPGVLIERRLCACGGRHAVHTQSAAHFLAAGRGRGLGGDPLGGIDDELGLGDLLRSLSQLAGEAQRPNTRK